MPLIAPNPFQVNVRDVINPHAKEHCRTVVFAASLKKGRF